MWLLIPACNARRAAQAIVDSIIAGDIDAACEQSRMHNESEGKLLVEHLLEIEAARALAEKPARRRSV